MMVKEEMDKALFKQHLRHFSNASRTPFTMDLIRSHFGVLAEQETCIAYRTRNLNREDLGLDRYKTEFLKGLQRNEDDLPKINTKINKTQIQQ
eukprot:6943202-Ditylum_brightwellii.AAC.1